MIGRLRGPSPRERWRGEQGFTLTELLVVMVLFGAVGTILATSAIQTQRTINNTEVLLDEVTQARTSMVEISRVMRTARREVPNGPQFVESTGSTFTFYANFRHDSDIGPKLIRLTVEGDELVEYIQDAILDTSVPSNFRHDPIASGQRRVLVRDLTNDASTPVFSYLARDGDPVAVPDQPGGDTVARVDVALVVGGPPVRSRPTVVTQQVRLANFLRN